MAIYLKIAQQNLKRKSTSIRIWDLSPAEQNCKSFQRNRSLRASAHDWVGARCWSSVFKTGQLKSQHRELIILFHNQSCITIQLSKAGNEIRKPKLLNCWKKTLPYELRNGSPFIQMTKRHDDQTCQLYNETQATHLDSSNHIFGGN